MRPTAIHHSIGLGGVQEIRAAGFPVRFVAIGDRIEAIAPHAAIAHLLDTLADPLPPAPRRRSAITPGRKKGAHQWLTPPKNLRKGDDRAFASAKFQWLNAIALDGAFSDTARRIAIRFAAHYVRRRPADPSSDRVAYPAVARLCSELRCSRASIFRALDQLVRLGYLREEARAGETTRYRLSFPTAGVIPRKLTISVGINRRKNKALRRMTRLKFATPLPVSKMRPHPSTDSWTPYPSQICDPTRLKNETQYPGNEYRGINTGEILPSARSASPHAEVTKGEKASPLEPEAGGLFGQEPAAERPESNRERPHRPPASRPKSASTKQEAEGFAAFRAAYPPGRYVPVDDGGWQKSERAFKAALKRAPAATITDGAHGLAASGRPPDRVPRPTNWLEKSLWR